MTKLYLTITGFSSAFQLIPFQPGQLVQLQKSQDYFADPEAIIARLPYLGTIGFVSNSSDLVIKGTLSGGRLYDRFEKETVAEVAFITDTQIICKLPTGKKAKKLLKNYYSIEKKLQKDHDARSAKLNHEQSSKPASRLSMDVSQAKKMGITPIWENGQDNKA